MAAVRHVLGSQVLLGETRSFCKVHWPRRTAYVPAFSGEVKSSDNLRKGEEHVQVLHLNSSGADEKSWTGIASSSFFEAYKKRNPYHRVKEVNLWDRNLLQYNLTHVASKMRMVAGQETREDRENNFEVEKMIRSLFSANKLVISSPMWNYSVPYVLKQYIDCIVQPGLTFKESKGGPRGLVTGRPLLLITSSGGDYSNGPMARLDYQVPYLKDIFGLIGFDDVRHIYIKNTAHEKKVNLLEYIELAVEKEVAQF